MTDIAIDRQYQKIVRLAVLLRQTEKDWPLRQEKQTCPDCGSKVLFRDPSTCAVHEARQKLYDQIDILPATERQRLEREAVRGA